MTALDFAEIHDQLRSVASELLGSVPAADAVDWGLLAEAGWLGLEVPEALDGAGATFAEVAVILDEMGRATTRSAYLGSVVLGVAALHVAQPGAGRDDLLRSIGSGAAVVVPALSGDATVGAADLPFVVDRSGGSARVRGAASFVVDAPVADHLLLPAVDGDDPVLVAVEAGTPSLAVEDRPVLDETRRFGAVVADGVAIADDAVLPVAGDPVRCLAGLRDRAAVAVACDSLGVSEAMLAATVAYASVRQQFGRPIGSFQAVKHACADMLVSVSVARELVSAAVAAVAGDEDAAVPASMAKAYACDTAVAVAGSAMQLHGGIGYTWESGIHVHLKRAALNRSLFGSPVEHRRRLAARYR